ncbi:MAG TPA: hypothetical protein VN108_11675, partial [Marmoricola sp.]|nr:hypothetical protein [Marmoricola sp.]
TTTQAACLGTGVINDFGVERAIKYKFLAAGNKAVTLTTPILSANDAATFTDTFMSCTNAVASIKSDLIQQIAPNTAEGKAKLSSCLDQQVTTARVKKALVARFSGDSNGANLNSVFAACSSIG